MPHGTVTIITIKKPTNTSLINIDVIIKKSKTFAPCFLHQRHDRITRGFVQAGLTPIFSSFCIIVLLVVIEHLFFKALPSQSPKTMVAMRITTDHRRTYGAKAIRQVRPQRETGCRRLSRTQGPKRHTVPAAGPCPCGRLARSYAHCIYIPRTLNPDGRPDRPQCCFFHVRRC